MYRPRLERGFTWNRIPFLFVTQTSWFPFQIHRNFQHRNWVTHILDAMKSLLLLSLFSFIRLLSAPELLQKSCFFVDFMFTLSSNDYFYWEWSTWKLLWQWIENNLLLEFIVGNQLNLHAISFTKTRFLIAWHNQRNVYRCILSQWQQNPQDKSPGLISKPIKISFFQSLFLGQKMPVEDFNEWCNCWECHTFHVKGFAETDKTMTHPKTTLKKLDPETLWKCKWPLGVKLPKTKFISSFRPETKHKRIKRIPAMVNLLA